MVVRTEKPTASAEQWGAGEEAWGVGRDAELKRHSKRPSRTEILGHTSPKPFPRATFTSEGAEGTEDEVGLVKTAERGPEGEAHGQEED